MYLKEEEKRFVEFWRVFILCKTIFIRCSQKFFRYFAVVTECSAKDSTSITFTALGPHPFLIMSELLTLLFPREKWALFRVFYSESVRLTVLKWNIFIIIKLPSFDLHRLSSGRHPDAGVLAVDHECYLQLFV